jgi:hypothetical protein
MTVGIVEILEIVDIQQQQAQFVPVAVEPFDLPFELVVKCRELNNWVSPSVMESFSTSPACEPAPG